MMILGFLIFLKLQVSHVVTFLPFFGARAPQVFRPVQKIKPAMVSTKLDWNLFLIVFTLTLQSGTHDSHNETWKTKRSTIWNVIYHLSYRLLHCTCLLFEVFCTLGRVKIMLTITRCLSKALARHLAVCLADQQIWMFEVRWAIWKHFNAPLAISSLFLSFLWFLLVRMSELLEISNFICFISTSDHLWIWLHQACSHCDTLGPVWILDPTDPTVGRKKGMGGVAIVAQRCADIVINDNMTTETAKNTSWRCMMPKNDVPGCGWLNTILKQGNQRSTILQWESWWKSIIWSCKIGMFCQHRHTRTNTVFFSGSCWLSRVIEITSLIAWRCSRCQTPALAPRTLQSSFQTYSCMCFLQTPKKKHHSLS